MYGRRSDRHYSFGTRFVSLLGNQFVLPATRPPGRPMNGSKKELEDRVQAAERLLKEMEASLARTKRLIEEARQILDDAASDQGGNGTPAAD